MSTLTTRTCSELVENQRGNQQRKPKSKTKSAQQPRGKPKPLKLRKR